VIPEIYVLLIKTVNDIRVVDDAVNLLLVLCFVYFGLLTFVKLHQDSSWLAIIHSESTVHQSCKTLKIAALYTGLQIKDFSDCWYFLLVRGSR